jgi:hypothetical protein
MVGSLHSHKVGGLRAHKPYDILASLDVLVDRVGAEALTGNVIRFFDGIDKCWSLRQLSGSRDEPRPHLNTAFLLTLGRLFSSYTDFWDGTERNDFYFLEKFVKRLRKFPLGNFISPAKGVQTELLYEILRKHLNLDPVFEMPPMTEAEPEFV